MKWIDKLTLRSDAQDTDSLSGFRGTGPGSESRWTLGTVKAYIAAAITKASIGLGNVTNHAQVRRDEMGANNGVATLGNDGKVTPSQLPSATSTNWGGIGGTLADQGDLQSALNGKAASSHTHAISDVTGLQSALDGKAASSHTHAASEISDSTTAGRALLTAANVSAQKTALSLAKADVGLGNVDNTSDANKPVSTATQAALDLKADSDDARFPTTGQAQAMAGTTGDPGSDNRFVTELDGRIDRQFDVVASFNGSGCATRTTGSINSGATLLAVASTATFRTGQGIFIATAGAGGASLVTSITNVLTGAISVAATASATVASVLVQHDDTAAINAAIQAAFDNYGGIVYLTKKGTDDGTGVYRCNGPRNVTTNAIITFPQTEAVAAYGGSMNISIIGEVQGSLADNDDGDSWSDPVGVAIDAQQAAVGSGTSPSVISGGIGGGGLEDGWNHIHLEVDRLCIVTSGASKLSGINGAKFLTLILGDKVIISCSYVDSAPVFKDDSDGTFGVHFPGRTNAGRCIIGSTYINGYTTGIVGTEHMRFDMPNVQYCKYGLLMLGGGHKMTGTMMIDSTVYPVHAYNVPPGFVQPVDLFVQVEDNPAAGGGGGSFKTLACLYDPDNRVRGQMRFQVTADGNGRMAPTTLGAQNVDIVNLWELKGPETMLAHWPFDGDLLNKTRFANDLVGHGTPTFATGRTGDAECLVLNGTSQWADVWLDDPLTSHYILNISFWAWLDALPATAEYRSPLSRYDGTDSWGLFLNDAGMLYLLTHVGTGGGSYRTVNCATFPVNEWHKIMVQLDTRRGRARIRMDDGAWNEILSSGAASDVGKARVYNPSNTKFTVGAVQGDYGLGGPGWFWDGKIQDLRVETRDVPDEEWDERYAKETA